MANIVKKQRMFVQLTYSVDLETFPGPGWGDHTADWLDLLKSKFPLAGNNDHNEVLEFGDVRVEDAPSERPLATIQMAHDNLE